MPKSSAENTLFRSGFVAIVGRPNVGKSTLLNALLGQKLAAVSDKPQTTRWIVRGILNTPRGQAVFIDTPGFHSPVDRLGRWMRREIDASIQDADLILWIIEPSGLRREDQSLLERLKALAKPAFLLINKVDTLDKRRILPLIAQLKDAYPFRKIVPLSALRGDNLDCLVPLLLHYLPSHPPYFPDDILSPQSEREIVVELIREKIFRFTEEEIPYSSTVVIDEFKEGTPVQIQATVVVERESQKGIVIGAGGKMIRRISEAARKEAEQFLGRAVELVLWVKVVKNWKKDDAALRRLGYNVSRKKS